MQETENDNEATSIAAPDEQSSPTRKSVIVRAYGARLLDNGYGQAHADQIFRAQNRLWNALVEIERGARQKYREALVQSDDEMSDLTARAERQQLLIDSLMEQRNKERAKARTKKTDNAQSFAVLIKDASAELKRLRAAIKEIRARAKEAARPVLETLELERREQVKKAIKDAGLWWAHSETVVAKFDVARVRAMREGTELKFHRYDGQGSMGVRFTGGGAMLSKVLAGATSMLTIRDPSDAELGPMKRQKSDGGIRKIIEVRAGEKAEDKTKPYLRFLVTLHAGRDFAYDAPLKTVTLRCDRHVNKPEWKIVFTFVKDVPNEDTTHNLPPAAVGIDFGFRLVTERDGNQGLRVASIADGNRVRHIVLDHRWMRRMQHADAVRGRLDDTSNRFWESIKQTMGSDAGKTAIERLPEDDWFRVLAGKVMRAKHAYASLLMNLCSAHTKAGKVLGEDIEEQMRSFHGEALSLALQAHHARRRAVDHRKHIYRNVAAELARTAGLIAIEDSDLRELAKRNRDDGTENELVQTARRNRTWAAPSELRLAIEQAAKREGRELVKVPAANTTRTCAACGHIHQGGIEDLTFVCQGCGTVWDQDENAAVNIRNFAIKGQEMLGETVT